MMHFILLEEKNFLIHGLFVQEYHTINDKAFLAFPAQKLLQTRNAIFIHVANRTSIWEFWTSNLLFNWNRHKMTRNTLLHYYRIFFQKLTIILERAFLGVYYDVHIVHHVHSSTIVKAPMIFDREHSRVKPPIIISPSSTTLVPVAINSQYIITLPRQSILNL